MSVASGPFSSPAPALEKSCLQLPLDCDDIYAQGYQADGVYLIYPSGPSVPVPVFCDMTTEGGKWTVSGGGTGAHCMAVSLGRCSQQCVERHHPQTLGT